MDISILSPLSSFGELLNAESTPTVQIDALKGINPAIHETFTGPSGTVTVKTDHNGKEFHMQSGTSVGGYGLLRSLNVLRYRPGQGARLRYTARFGTPVALAAQRAGAVNVGTELSFGYNGLDFGILYRTGGRLEIQTLTITNPAGGAETLTLTLNDTPYTITLSSGTAPHNAFEIVADDGFAATHNAYQNGSTVIFVSTAVGPETGTFSFSSDGVATGTFAQTGAGVAVTDVFTNQTNWNINTLTAATDTFVLDPSKGNIYEISYQYLGYGSMTFRIMDPATDNFIPVHVIEYANANASPNLETPLFKVGWFAASLGTTTNTEIFGASASCFVDGKINPLINPLGHSNTKTGVGTTLTNIISFRVRPEFNGFVDLSQILPKIVSVAVDGTKPASVEVHINASVAGEPNWQYHNKNVDVMEFDTAGTDVTAGTEVVVVSLAKSGSAQIDMNDLAIRLNRTETITIAAKASSGTTDATASMTWVED
jgi:hypothetical protein